MNATRAQDAERAARARNSLHELALGRFPQTADGATEDAHSSRSTVAIARV
jgi:hypothetical protein